mmetsp:Transcript_21295/g.63642  ORF Transcript_21295/g.63642 Transcript_21295/m.63642 type:complete len:289 (+) Transcript_21295:330-1196(+)
MCSSFFPRLDPLVQILHDRVFLLHELLRKSLCLQFLRNTIKLGGLLILPMLANQQLFLLLQHHLKALGSQVDGLVECCLRVLFRVREDDLPFVFEIDHDFDLVWREQIELTRMVNLLSVFCARGLRGTMLLVEVAVEVLLVLQGGLNMLDVILCVFQCVQQLGLDVLHRVCVLLHVLAVRELREQVERERRAVFRQHLDWLGLRFGLLQGDLQRVLLQIRAGAVPWRHGFPFRHREVFPHGRNHQGGNHEQRHGSKWRPPSPGDAPQMGGRHRVSQSGKRERGNGGEA